MGGWDSRAKEDPLSGIGRSDGPFEPGGGSAMMENCPWLLGMGRWRSMALGDEMSQW